MAYDLKLEARIDRLTDSWELDKKKMFGGVGYKLGGNLACGIHKDELIVRAAAEQVSELLKQPGIRNFDMGRGPMKGWLLAGGPAIKTDESLLKLLEISRDYASSLPPK